MHRGYIKIYRKIFDSEIWEEKPFSRGQAWLDLILLANHKKGYFRVRGIRVDIERGQVGTSSKTLATRWGWSRGKVLRFLHELETAQQIVQQKNNVSSLISIVNYDQYQGNDTANGTQTGRKRDANGTQTDTNNNDKNGKNVKKDKKRKFGSLKNVLLSEKEYKKLSEKFNGTLTEKIENLSLYIASKGTRYKSHYATILAWDRKDKKESSLATQNTCQLCAKFCAPSSPDKCHKSATIKACKEFTAR